MTSFSKQASPVWADEPVASKSPHKIRLAVVISHPIQYYAPLYQRLALRKDLDLKVFFTWHCGKESVEDPGFRRSIAWDIPLTDGYAYELIPNNAADPGTHHFFGLRNPTLVERVLAWRPDVVQISGWAWYSNLNAIQAFARLGTPTLFRGDSHLLDPITNRVRWWIKKNTLRHIYSKLTAFLVVGAANRAYYEAFGVEPERLIPCPHSIDVSRFAEPAGDYERQAACWRRELGIADNRRVLLFAGKFERKKRPIDLMRAVQTLNNPNVVLIMVGNGELQEQVETLASANPDRFKVLPFQNQSRMPVVYRLGDLFVLPSGHDETWGLAVNEAIACGRPVLVSSCVGCAQDVVAPLCGRVFAANDDEDLTHSLGVMMRDAQGLKEMGRAAGLQAWRFDVSRTETSMVDAIHRVCSR